MGLRPLFSLRNSRRLTVQLRRTTSKYHVDHFDYQNNALTPCLFNSSSCNSVTPLDISTNIQKEPWFIAINPNGRIPALTHEGTRVFETSAILLYLAEVFDKERKFSYDSSKDLKTWAELQSWLMFAVSP